MTNGLLVYQSICIGISVGICVGINIGIRVRICVGISTETQGNHRQPPNTEELKSNYPSKEVQEQCIGFYVKDSREETAQATTDHLVAKV